MKRLTEESAKRACGIKEDDRDSPNNIDATSNDDEWIEETLVIERTSDCAKRKLEEELDGPDPGDSRGAFVRVLDGIVGLEYTERV